MANSKLSTVQLQLVLVSMAALATASASAAATTRLRFYMHDTVTTSAGNPATVAPVARGTTPLPGAPTTRFGDMYVIDDPLTEGPGAASPAVGRAQGFYLFAAQHELAVMHCLNIVFTAGKHNGSYLVVQARDAILDKVRELPVIGGAGSFRGATGYGLLRTHSFNSSTNNAVLKIDMYLRVKQYICLEFLFQAPF